MTGPAAMLTHRYVRTAKGRAVHYATAFCVGACDSSGEARRGSVAMTEQQAAEWLAADPRRGLCGLCRPVRPYGRLRVVR